MIFELFSPPPPKKINFGGVQKFFCQKWKKSKMFKIAWNGKKIGRKRFLDFLAPPPKKIRGVQQFFVEDEKSKLFKITWNGKKIGWKWFFGFLTPLYSKRKFEKVLDDKK